MQRAMCCETIGHLARVLALQIVVRARGCGGGCAARERAPGRAARAAEARDLVQQTQKAVGNTESDLKGYMQDVRTLSLQLNEGQVEASHAFACLEQQCTIVATQKANMTHAALQRRRVFKSRADAALVQVTLARCKHREHNAQVAKQVQTVKLEQRQHVMTMLRSLIYLTPAANPNSLKFLLIYANLSTLSHKIPGSPNLQKQKQVSQTA
jgi:hypothetical protein